MEKAPAFQVYAADFYMDVLGWSNEEVGAYWRLLMYSWVNGPMPNEMKELSQIAQCGAKKFSNKWKRLQTKFTLNDEGKYINLRLEQTRAEQIKYRESLSKAGKKGAKKRWNKDGDPNGYPNGDPNFDPINPPNGKKIALQSSSSLKEKQVKESEPTPYLADLSSQITELAKKLARLSLAYPKTGYRNFNVNGLIQKFVNQKKHPQAILDVLWELAKRWTLTGKDEIKNPQGYAETIMKTKSGNYYEREHTAKSQEFKNLEMPGELLRGKGG